MDSKRTACASVHPLRTGCHYSMFVVKLVSTPASLNLLALLPRQVEIGLCYCDGNWEDSGFVVGRTLAMMQLRDRTSRAKKREMLWKRRKTKAFPAFPQQEILLRELSVGLFRRADPDSPTTTPEAPILEIKLTQIFQKGTLGKKMEWMARTWTVGRQSLMGHGVLDRKSIRLNSSHANISYAV